MPDTSSAPYPSMQDEDLLRVLRAALDQTRSAAVVTTAELDLPGPEILYVNPAYCRMTGHAAADVVGATPRILQGPLTDRSMLDRLRAELSAGQPFTGETVNYKKDGSPFLISWRIDPVVDAAGRTTHFIATQEDVTHIRRTERRLAAEQQIDRALGEILADPQAIEADLVRLGEEIVAAAETVAHVGSAHLIGEIRVDTSSLHFHAGEVSAALGDRLVDTVADASFFGTYRRWDADDSGARWIGLPIGSARTGLAAGLFLCGLDQDQSEFVDVRGLEMVASRAGLAIGSLADYERQRHAALSLQQGLLPTTGLAGTGLDIAVRYQPGAFGSDIGGDWYDVICTNRGSVLLVGDVAGSGVVAAAAMGRIRLLTRVLLQQGAGVDEMLAAANDYCDESGLVATILAVTVDAKTKAMTTMSAGHPPPIVAGAAGGSIVALDPGPLLGIGGTPTYRPTTRHLDQDELVVMFTDGLIERPGEIIDAGLERLTGRLEAVPGSPREACEELLAARLAEGPADDIAIMAFRLSA